MGGWLYAPQIIQYGSGVFEQAADIVKRFGSRVLIVSDPVMRQLGIVERTSRMLSGAGLAVSVYDEIGQEPTLQHVRSGLDVLREAACDVLIAVGGGSCMDTAKAIAAMAVNPGDIGDYRGNAQFIADPLPLICVPTTAGTGSEVTKVTVITDEEQGVKMMISQPGLMPRAALVDPLLTLTCPSSVTAATGIDAICHAVEAYLSRKAHPLTDTLAIGALRLMKGSLIAAYEDGENIEARTNMAIGSMMAGMSFSNASVTLIHGMSRPIGGLFHVPHGISNAMLLPVVLDFTMPQAVDRLADIGLALKPELGGALPKERAAAAVSELKELCRRLHIPNLQGWGIEREPFMSALPKMAADAIDSGSPGNHPNVPSADQIIELYKTSYDYQNV